MDLDPRTVPGGRPPDDPDGARAWLRESPLVLLDAVSVAGHETPVATLVGRRPAHWWVRRRLHEATVHRADATLAAGGDYSLDPELAADGIEEWLERLVIELPSHNRVALSPGHTLSLFATDLQHGWRITGLVLGIAWTGTGQTSQERTTTRLVGPATDLFLALTRRDNPRGLNVRISGEADTWTGWLAHTPL